MPVPVDSEQVIEAIFEGMLREGPEDGAELSPGFEEVVNRRKSLFQQWETSAEREALADHVCPGNDQGRGSRAASSPTGPRPSAPA